MFGTGGPRGAVRATEQSERLAVPARNVARRVHAIQGAEQGCPVRTGLRPTLFSFDRRPGTSASGRIGAHRSVQHDGGHRTDRLAVRSSGAEQPLFRGVVETTSVVSSDYFGAPPYAFCSTIDGVGED